MRGALLRGCLVALAVCPPYAIGQEARFEPGIGVTFPYLLESTSGNGDTRMGASFGIRATRHLWITQGLEIGIVGRHAVRYELGPMVRLFPARSLTPHVGVGGVLQVHPEADGGFFGRVGVTWDAARVVGLWHLGIQVDSGPSLLFRKPRTLEWQLVRAMITFPF